MRFIGPRSAPWLRRSALAAALATLTSAVGAQAQQATLTGRVTAAGTNEPLADARVMVVNTSVATSTNSEGRYTLRGVPIGSIDVRVIRVGYQEQKKPVSVAAGAAVTVDFSLAQAIVQLQEIVTTATGEQRKVELGNALTTISAPQNVEQRAVSNVSDLLTAKAPGVIIAPPNMTGGAPTIRIRGQSSISLSNAPIVIVDGVRFDSDPISVGNRGVGGTTGSLFNSLSPEEIEDVEIVKGPSAATLYGTDAANGVIVITTKKGRAGSTRWSWFADANAVKDNNKYPPTYAIWGHSTTTGKVQRCELATMVTPQNPGGACTQDSVTSIDIAGDPTISPIATGHNTNYGGQVSGGSDAVRYFASADLFNETGPYKMPSFAQEWLVDTAKATLNDSWIHPEAYQRQNMRANFNAAVSPKIDLSVNAGFSKSDQRLPQVDNNVNGIGGAMYLTYGTNHSGLDYNPVGALGENLHGYARFTPASIFQFTGNTNIQRLTTSADAQWRPLTWMQNQATVGVDLADQVFTDLCHFGECPAFGTNRQGFVDDEHDNNRIFSAKVVSNSSWNPRSWLNMKTTLGADYLNNESDFARARGATLPPGAQTTGAASTQTVSDGFQSAQKTLGLYVQEQAAFRDRMFATAAVRSDQNSAFGTNFQRVFYPKLSLSWIMSDESFFPHIPDLDQFRLRLAYGQSGVQPGPTDALRRFNATSTSFNSVDIPGLFEVSIANPNLKPERSGEFEGGFEAKVANRVNVDFTYYNKRTKDALVSEPIAPSAAPPSTTLGSNLSVRTNLASTTNSGLEAQINATLVDSRNFGWDVVLTGSHNTNRINSLGVLPNGQPIPTIAVFTDRTVRDSVGFPIGGLFLRGFSFQDKNGDGIIQANEVTVDTTFQYRGYTSPRDLFSIQNGFDLLQRRVRISALIDYKGGYNLENSSMQFICQQAPQACVEDQVASTSIDRQARAVAQNFGTTVNGQKFTTVSGYWENGQFWRLRELSATLQVPEAAAARVRARDANIVLGARNIVWWGAYTGVDPESNYASGTGVGNSIPQDFLTTAPRRYFEVRLNLHY